MSAIGAQRASVVTARRLASSRPSLCSAKTLLVRRCSAKACTARVLRTRSTVTAASRPELARASDCAPRTSRRWRAASTSSTGSTATATSAIRGSRASSTASTASSRTASGSRVEQTATSASSSRLVSLVIRDTSSPDRVASCQRSESVIARSNRVRRNRAPTRSAARSACSTAPMSTRPLNMLSATSAIAARVSTVPAPRPATVRPSTTVSNPSASGQGSARSSATPTTPSSADAVSGRASARALGQVTARAVGMGTRPGSPPAGRGLNQTMVLVPDACGSSARSPGRRGNLQGSGDDDRGSRP